MLNKKELEEAIKILKYQINMKDTDVFITPNLEAIEIVLNYIDNSIPKEVIENYLKDEKEKFEVYKKESENNENLKGQMWHHMGAKNMCERILEIEKLVTLD